MFKNYNPVIIIGLIGLIGISCQNPSNGSRDSQIRLHTDLAVRTFGGSVYILERNGRDNVIKCEAAGVWEGIAAATAASDFSAAGFEIVSAEGATVRFEEMAVVYQQNLGTGLNIQDIAIISDTKAYISCHNDNSMIVFDPKAGKKISTIDLSRFNSYVGTDSAEASPFASALAVHGNYVYAACQRLKTVQESWGTNIVAGDTSLIAVIDARTDAVVKSIALRKKNPASMSILGGRMLVSCTGDWYDASTGGVEAIDLAGGVNAGIVVEGGLFGGSISNIAFVSSSKAYIAVGKMSGDFLSYWTEIVPFDPSTGSVGAKIGGIDDGFGGIAYDGAKVYVGDRDLGAPGIAVVNPAANAVERKIPTGMPPSALAVIFPN